MGWYQASTNGSSGIKRSHRLWIRRNSHQSYIFTVKELIELWTGRKDTSRKVKNYLMGLKLLLWHRKTGAVHELGNTLYEFFNPYPYNASMYLHLCPNLTLRLTLSPSLCYVISGFSIIISLIFSGTLVSLTPWRKSILVNSYLSLFFALTP